MKTVVLVCAIIILISVFSICCGSKAKDGNKLYNECQRADDNVKKYCNNRKGDRKKQKANRYGYYKERVERYFNCSQTFKTSENGACKSLIQYAEYYCEYHGLTFKEELSWKECLAKDTAVNNTCVYCSKNGKKCYTSSIFFLHGECRNVTVASTTKACKEVIRIKRRLNDLYVMQLQDIWWLDYVKTKKIDECRNADEIVKKACEPPKHDYKKSKSDPYYYAKARVVGNIKCKEAIKKSENSVCKEAEKSASIYYDYLRYATTSRIKFNDCYENDERVKENCKHSKYCKGFISMACKKEMENQKEECHKSIKASSAEACKECNDSKVKANELYSQLLPQK